MRDHENLSPVAVRVDFKTNGEIIPLGIIDKNGKTRIIDKVEKITPFKVEKNHIDLKFYCKSSKDWFWLYFINMKWYI